MEAIFSLQHNNKENIPLKSHNAKTLKKNGKRRFRKPLRDITHLFNSSISAASEFELSNFPAVNLEASDYPNHKPENEDYNDVYIGRLCYEGEDEEMSWFNAGVRVGVGIGLSMCVVIEIGVGLLARTYQGATRNVLKRRLQ